MENLLEAWQEFIRGKKAKKDVQEFQRNLMTNIISLHNDLASKTYEHSLYEAFNLSDPKPRNIHKAKVRDRLLHHALYRKLYPFFDKNFINDSYSCRFGKGTHAAQKRFTFFSRKASENHTKTIWVLKCDIKKFFASIDHICLTRILNRYIVDNDLLWLLGKIIQSFESTGKGKGLPLGNLTSQLLVNIYMNEFDQYIKHILKQKYYIRYADDFVFISQDKTELINLLPKIQNFLFEKVSLIIHPKKVSLKAFASGIDFLGWVHFPDHRVLRTASKRRMFAKVKNAKQNTSIEEYQAIVQSYIGLLRHGNTEKLKTKLSTL